MRETRPSQTLIWLTISVLSLSVLWGQYLLAGQRSSADAEPSREGMNDSTWEAWITLPPPPELECTTLSASTASLDAATPDLEVVDLFVEAIVQVESAGNPRCTGKAGERGLMQIKSGTWRDTTHLLFGSAVTFSRAYEPALNRQVGKAYLAYLQGFLHTHRSEWSSDRRSLLLACYNAGPGMVARSGFDIDRLNASTRDYVGRVSSLHDFYLAEAKKSPSEQTVRTARAPDSGMPDRT